LSVTFSAPEGFPTHRHSAEFWEALGRAVATFGFLEETLAKAIFAFSRTRALPDRDHDECFDAWLPELKQTLSDTLISLIEKFEAAVRSQGKMDFNGLDAVLAHLRALASLRNVLCHGSWKSPDVDGRSLPFFLKRTGEMFDTPVDVAFLRQTQLATADAIRLIVEMVVTMGWQFPGIKSPGEPLF